MKITISIILTTLLLQSCTFNYRQIASSSNLTCIQLIDLLSGGDFRKITTGQYFSLAAKEGDEIKNIDGHITKVGTHGITIRTDEGYQIIHRKNIIPHKSIRLRDHEGVIRITRVENFHDKKHLIEEVIGLEFRDNKIPILKVAPEFNKKTDFAVGITMDGIHSYLLIGNSRLDGDIFKMAHLSTRTSMVSPGFIFHYKGNDPKAIQGAKEYLKHFAKKNGKSSFFTQTCYQGVCKALQDGAEIKLPGRQTLWGTEIFNSMFDSGFLKHGTEKIDYDIYVTRQNSISDSYFNLNKLQSETAAVATIFITVSGTATMILIAYGAYKIRSGER